MTNALSNAKMLWMLFTDPFSRIKIFLLKQEEERIFVTAEASPNGMDKAGPWSSCYEKACCGLVHTRNFRDATIYYRWAERRKIIPSEMPLVN